MADSPRPFQRACKVSGGLADGPAQVGGRSATLFQKLSREVVSLAWAKRLDGGRSDLWTRTVRRSLNFLTRDIFASGGLHVVKADGPFKGCGRSAPQTLSLSRDAVSLNARSV